MLPAEGRVWPRARRVNGFVPPGLPLGRQRERPGEVHSKDAIRGEGKALHAETRPGEIIACALWAVSLCLHVIGLLSFTSSVSLLLTPFYSLSRSCA